MDEANLGLMNLKKQARSYCRQIKLDRAIRTLCRGDGSAGSSTNRRIEIPLENGKILELAATWGDGFNGTYARYKPQVIKARPSFHLYEAIDYGKDIIGFQNGVWVKTVLDLAGQGILAQMAQSQAREIMRIQEELKRWMSPD